jgi:hypothetical protein
MFDHQQSIQAFFGFVYVTIGWSKIGYALDRTWVFFGEVVSTPQVSIQDLRIAMASALIQ